MRKRMIVTMPSRAGRAMSAFVNFSDELPLVVARVLSLPR
jgi:hypothetical protein